MYLVPVYYCTVRSKYFHVFPYVGAKTLLRMLRRCSEMLALGSNTEIDFQRRLSIGRFARFPGVISTPRDVKLVPLGSFFSLAPKRYPVLRPRSSPNIHNFTVSMSYISHLELHGPIRSAISKTNQNDSKLLTNITTLIDPGKRRRDGNPSPILDTRESWRKPRPFGSIATARGSSFAYPKLDTVR
jgi:hypothetical protein